MSKTRTQKAILNLATALVSEFVSIICGFVLPRLILSNYGSEYNGIISSAQQFLTVVSLLTLGVTASTRVALYKTLANKDIGASSRILRTTEIYMRKVGLVLAAFVVVLSIVYPRYVKTEYGYWEVALLIIATGIGTFGQYCFGTAYQAFLMADQSLYIVNLFGIFSAITNTVLSVILIRQGFSIQVVKFGSATIFFLRPLVLNIYVTKKYGIDKHCKPDQSAMSMRNDAMASALAKMVHDNTDIIVLTLFTTVKIVSVYTVYNLVMSALKKVQETLTSNIEPIFGDMWAKGEYDKIRKDLGLCETCVFTFVSVVFATTLVMLLPFVRLYTKGVTDVEYIIPAYAIVVTIAFAMHCIRAPYLTLVQGAGKYKETKNAAIIEACINLGLSIILVQLIGIVGVAVGTLAANLFRTCHYAVYIDKNLVKRGLGVFTKKVIWTFANIAVIGLITFRFTVSYVTTWPKWILAGVAVLAISAIVTILSAIIFYRSDFRESLELAKRMMGKKLMKKT